MKNTMKIILLCAITILTGCSSTMSHTGSNDKKYYAGTHTSYQMLISDNTHWGIKSLVILDMPFTVMLDTLLLPWDALKNQRSIKSQIEEPDSPSPVSSPVR